MAINTANNTGGGDFKFLKNQSSILRTADANDVTINGVNVIVDKPKRGDVLCVKDGQVVWIDGLSINPDQLSSEIEPVGICMVIRYIMLEILILRHEKQLAMTIGVPHLHMGNIL